MKVYELSLHKPGQPDHTGWTKSGPFKTREAAERALTAALASGVASNGNIDEEDEDE